MIMVQCCLRRRNTVRAKAEHTEHCKHRNMAAVASLGAVRSAVQRAQEGVRRACLQHQRSAPAPAPIPMPSVPAPPPGSAPAGAPIPGIIAAPPDPSFLELRDMLATCTRRLQNVVVDRLGRSVKLTTAQLRAICDDLGFAFDFQADDHTVFISTDTFFLELVLNEGGTVQTVKIAHGDLPEAEDAFLLKLVQDGNYRRFSDNLKAFKELYEIGVATDLKMGLYAAVMGLEKDMATAAGQQSALGSGLVLSNTGYGLVVPRHGGEYMRTVVFSPPSALVSRTSGTSCDDAEGLDDASSRGCIVAAVQLEGTTAPCSIPKIATANVETTPLSFAQPGESDCLAGVVGVLRFNRPLLVEQSVFDAVQNASAEMLCAQAEPATSGLPFEDWANALSPGMTKTGKTPCCVDVGGSWLCFSLDGSGMGGEHGRRVEKVRFSSMSQVLPVLEVLRRQLLYNHLLASCFPSEGQAEGRPGSSDCLFEVTVQPGFCLVVTGTHPANAAAIMSWTIEVPAAREIKVTFHLAPGTTLPVSEEQCAKTLLATYSIPVTMHALRLKCNPSDQVGEEKDEAATPSKATPRKKMTRAKKRVADSTAVEESEATAPTMAATRSRATKRKRP
eukprot:m.214454 g.214454  ORF g.214454 m.214454 type:complete len:616 (-) comp18620_c0_seq10:60-1907(-)